MHPLDAPGASPRYRLDHRSPHLGPRVVTAAETLAAALVALEAVRRWLRAAGAGGELVVVDQREAPGRVICTYRVDGGAPRQPDGRR
jgi:hypothetical protein